MRPVVKLKVKGVPIIIRKQGREISTCFQVICVIPLIMDIPTKTRGAAIVAPDISFATGAKGKRRRKRSPEITADKPLFAPSFIPVADSAITTRLLVPKKDPPIVEMLFENRILFWPSKSPVFDVNPASVPIPINVPVESKKEEIRRESKEENIGINP